MSDSEEVVEIRKGIDQGERIEPRLIIEHEIATNCDEDILYPDYIVEEVESETEEWAEAEADTVLEEGREAETDTESEDRAEAESDTETKEEAGNRELSQFPAHETDTDSEEDAEYTEYIEEEAKSEIEGVIEIQEEPVVKEEEEDSDSREFKEEDMRTEFELRFRLHDGSDICQGIYSQTTTVGALKRRVIEEWPQGKIHPPTHQRQVRLIHSGRILRDNDTLADLKTIFHNRLPRGIIIVQVVVRPTRRYRPAMRSDTAGDSTASCSCAIL